MRDNGDKGGRYFVSYIIVCGLVIGALIIKCAPDKPLIKLPDCIYGNFEPQRDITAYELAIIVKNRIGIVWDSKICFSQSQWDNLDPSIKRHFRQE